MTMEFIPPRDRKGRIHVHVSVYREWKSANGLVP